MYFKVFKIMKSGGKTSHYKKGKTVRMSTVLWEQRGFSRQQEVARVLSFWFEPQSVRAQWMKNCWQLVEKT